MVSRILSRRPDLPTPPRVEAVPADDKADEEWVQVSVLISMPNPSTRRSDAMVKGKTEEGVVCDDGSHKMTGKERRRSSEEGELPAVVLGIAEVGYRV